MSAVRGRMPAWRAALRLARRDALRAKGRTALVALMIGLPVLAVATVDVLWRSSALTAADRGDIELGPVAQARVEVLAQGAPVEQSPSADAFGAVGPEPGGGAEGGSDPITVDAARAALEALLPPGDSLVERREAWVRLRVGDRAVDAAGVELDVDTTPAGPYRLEAGRPATTLAQAAITTSLARHTGLQIGDTVTVAPLGGTGDDSARELEVVGLLASPWFSREVVTRPTALFGDGGGEPADGQTRTTWLVTGPTEVSWPDVLRFNSRGAVVLSRAVLADPPPDSEVPLFARQERLDSGPRAAVVSVALVVTGLALLEVALLAGPAFAVGARRNRRQLALVAAGGGDRRHVRSVVLGGGLVIGLGASAGGALAGVGLAAALRPVLERFEVAYFPSLHVRPLELLALVAVGTGTAVAAAVLPAVQASRQDVVGALAGRRGQPRVHRRVPVTGALVAVAGTVLAIAGALTRQSLVVLAGAALAELGLVATTGALVAGLARLSRPMPVSARIAVRDAARQRGRTAPAVAAVMTAVAGSVAVSLYLTAQDSRAEAAYTPSAAVGTLMWAGSTGPAGDQGQGLAAEVERVAGVLRAELPAAGVHLLGTLQGSAGDEQLNAYAALAPEYRCPPQDDGDVTRAEVEAMQADPRCNGNLVSYPRFSYGGGIVVDDGSAAAALAPQDTERVRTALARGSAVVDAPRFLWPDQTVHVTLERYGTNGPSPAAAEEIVVPAAVADLSGTDALLPPSAISVTGADVVPSAVIALPADVVTEAATECVSAALADAGVANSYVYVEQGYTSDKGLAVLALAVAAGVVTLGATGIAVGLAAADSRADLATLAAVGASPRVRRRVAGAQAAVVSVLGVFLGLVAGGVLGAVVVLMNRYGAMGFDQTWRVVVPVGQLGALAVGVPALAIGAGYALTRSTLPMVRRVGQ